jgi:hypothetical protein
MMKLDEKQFDKMIGERKLDGYQKIVAQVEDMVRRSSAFNDCSDEECSVAVAAILCTASNVNCLKLAKQVGFDAAQGALKANLHTTQVSLEALHKAYIVASEKESEDSNASVDLPYDEGEDFRG